MSAKGPEGFADLADLPEDQRIAVIGHYVVTHGKTVAVCVDDYLGKPERYIAKMQRQFPGVALLDRIKGPIAGVITLKFGPQ